jgi:hypothetical protein
MGSPGIGVSGAKNDLRNSLDKFEDFNYVIEDLIGSEIRKQRRLARSILIIGLITEV